MGVRFVGRFANKGELPLLVPLPPLLLLASFGSMGAGTAWMVLFDFILAIEPDLVEANGAPSSTVMAAVPQCVYQCSNMPHSTSAAVRCLSRNSFHYYYWYILEPRYAVYIFHIAIERQMRKWISKTRARMLVGRYIVGFKRSMHKVRRLRLQHNTLDKCSVPVPHHTVYCRAI
jgi:hypothetical protein